MQYLSWIRIENEVANTVELELVSTLQLIDAALNEGSSLLVSDRTNAKRELNDGD